MLCDLTSRGDSQNHADYASRLFGWNLSQYSLESAVDFERAWDFARSIGDYFRPVARQGRRVTQADLEPEQWHEWKSELSRVLRCAAGFFYQHFARGSRRVVFDGLEPVERFSESIQFEFFEIYLPQGVAAGRRMGRPGVVSRKVSRQRRGRDAHRYDQRAIGCLYLYTTPHVMLDELLAQPITQGDIFANANTIILMGRTQHNGRLGRASSP